MNSDTPPPAEPAPMPYANKGILTSGPVSGHLVRLSVPMIWGIFAIISFQLVDTFYVGLLGTTQLAALSFTFPLNYTIFSVTIGFGIAMSSVLSRVIGAGNEDDIKRITTHGLILVFGFGLIVALIGMSFHDAIFRALGASEDILPLIRDYMMIWFAGAVFITLPLVGNAALRAAGDSFTPSIIMTVVAIVNLILDPIMIFGLFGFPRLEIVGAALSTVLANAAAMAAGLYVIRRRKMLLPLRDLQLDQFGDSAKRLLFIALPAGLTNAIQPLVSGYILYLLASYGPEAVAAFGVAGRIEAFAFIILMAVSVGMAPIIGQNWGAGQHARVQETLKLAIGFNVLWSLLVAIILGAFAGPIAGVFSDDPAVVDTTKTFFWIVPLSYVFGNLIQGWASAFNAMGKPERAFAMIFIKMIVMLIPAVTIGEHLGGVAGIFWAIAIVNTISGIGFHIYSARACRARQTGEDSPATL